MFNKSVNLNLTNYDFEKKFKDYLFRQFFLQIKCYNLNMSKRYSGKSFKDSRVSKKPKLNLKEKRKKKKEKTKKS